MTIFTQSIQVVRPGKKADPYNSRPILDYKSPTIFDVGFRVSVQPVAQSEGAPPRGGVTSRFLLITPPGTDLDLRVDDRVRIRAGDSFFDLDVVGPPQKWPDPFDFDTVHHVEAFLEAVRG